MDAKVGALLVAPSVRNFSCSHSRYNGQMLSNISTIEILQAILIFILTIGIVGANILVILIINNRKYTNYLHPQPRYLLTSLALNDLAIGLLITPFGLLPALLHCWPYGEIFCQIQALLRGALSQQSAVILICMAVDRYICALHPRRYYQHSSKKGCVIVLSVTWIFCLTIFGILVLPKGYYFNSTGLQACEPFYSKASYRILSTCSLYFPTTMILMYCYGSSFHASRFRFTAAVMQHQQQQQQQQQHNSTNPHKSSSNNETGIVSREKMIALEKKISGSTSRTMAAISLSFIVMVTPWTIQEVVAACIGSKVPALLDFLVTWAAISNSFWNPFLYWLLNAHFRRIGNEWLTSKWCSADDTSSQNSRCCSISSECDPINSLPLPPEPPLSRPPKTDIDGLSEKYWGEILERTVSSGSLHALQRTYGQQSMSQMGLTQSLHISTSEPRLCEPSYHNIDCAKNQTLACLRHSIKGLPDL